MEVIEFGVSAAEFDLSRLVAHVEGLGEREDWGPVLVMRVNLVLEELALNVRDHGCVEGRRFDVVLSSGHEAVGIEFTDDGVAFDPLVEAPEPDLSSNAEMRSLGGLGVHLVLSLVDEIRYDYGGGRNRLFMSIGRRE